MKEKSKEHSLKEMKLIMTCLTIICFCCTFITIFQNAILCFELGTNQAAIDAGKAAASEQFIWQAFPQGITLLSMAVCSVFIYLMLRNVKRNLHTRANCLINKTLERRGLSSSPLCKSILTDDMEESWSIGNRVIKS